MHIHLEQSEKHAIQSYNDTTIQINAVYYDQSFLVSRESLIMLPLIHSINDNDTASVLYDSLIQCNPEVLIIGCNPPSTFPSPKFLEFFMSKRIGVECMGIGSACRTYNILLSEQRNVVGVFIF